MKKIPYTLIAAALGVALTHSGFAQQKGGPGGDRKGPPEPEELAPALIKEFDKDGDSKLSEAELIAALKDMQRRMPPPPRGGR
ncbi:MAG: EF-hand domain-containing protein [Verrucomicrobiales bacterium]|nr:EF-hand domain-containing protein [Verrucomicrobiales bacterium]